MKQDEKAIDVEIPQQDDEGGVAKIPLRSGGRAAPIQDEILRSGDDGDDGDDRSAASSDNAPFGSWSARWLMCVESPPLGHSESKGDDDAMDMAEAA